MIDLQCEVCGEAFSVKPYRAKSARFCSLACGGKWHMSVRQMSGLHKAGNQYRKGLRPSNAFKAEEVRGPNNPKWVDPLEFKCANCGKAVHLKPWLARQNNTRTGLRFCGQPCFRSYMHGPNDPRYVGGIVTYRGRGWREIRLVAVERDKGTCQECGKYVGQSIPVHHKRPYREFSTPQEANALENLICLCQSCHMRIERPKRKSRLDAGPPSQCQFGNNQGLSRSL